MAYKYYDGTVFKIITPDNKELFFTCFRQGTSYGCRHICFKSKLSSPDKNKQVAKRSYYNMNWERYQFESVLEDAVELQGYDLSDCRVLIMRRISNGI